MPLTIYFTLPLKVPYGAPHPIVCSALKPSQDRDVSSVDGLLPHPHGDLQDKSKLLCRAMACLCWHALPYTPKLQAKDRHAGPPQRPFTPSSVPLTLVLPIQPAPTSLASLTRSTLESSHSAFSAVTLQGQAPRDRPGSAALL